MSSCFWSKYLVLRAVFPVACRRSVSCGTRGEVKAVLPAPGHVLQQMGSCILCVMGQKGWEGNA